VVLSLVATCSLGASASGARSAALHNVGVYVQHSNAAAQPRRSSSTPTALASKSLPGKVQVKVYLESRCPACRRFTTTYLKQVLDAPGVGDIVDLEMVAWGWGNIEIPPSRQELELDPKHPFDVLNHTAQLWRVEDMLQAGQDGELVFKCQHGFDVSIWHPGLTDWLACGGGRHCTHASVAGNNLA
jgi:hypothetical protein